MIVRILCIGDIVGAPGRMMVQKHLPRLKEQYKIDFTIVNGENSAGDGRGITPRIVQSLRHNKVDVITTGNHIWAKKEIYPFLDQNKDIVLRPANFPSETPGSGVAISTTSSGVAIAVINLQGRVFMRELVECPFKAATSLLTYVRSKASIIIVDFHAETTSEKIGLAHYLDGQISALFGTHTHVQTADERILPHGTAFITDIGMVGARNSMLGMKKDAIIQSIITQMPARFQVEITGPFILSGMVIAIDSVTGKAQSIERIQILDTEMVVDTTDE